MQGSVDTQATSPPAVGGAGTLARVRRIVNVRLPLLGEMLFIGLVIGAWELARMPIQGSHSLSLAHARDWITLEQSLRIDVESALIRFAHHANLEDVLRWSYYNFHLPVLFGFMALARLLRPERYPLLRSAFTLSHIPAIAVIGLYPLLPPRWVPGMPYAVAAPDGMNGAMHNATAAAASQHVGYPLFIAASTVWLTNLARWSWLAFLYPALVFLIVVGTANHYTLDGIIGGLCIVFGFATALLLNGLPALRREAVPPVALALLAAFGYALIVHSLNTASSLSLPPDPVTGSDLILLVGIAAVLGAWGWSRSEERGRGPWEPAAEARPQDALLGRLMPVYVALLRGVNVGGNRKLPMKELKPELEQLGLEDVVTYIQSGNVVFRAPAGARAKLLAQLERAIESRFGLDVSVMLRTPAELKKLIAANPFLDAKADVARLHVVFLDRKPAQAAVAKLDPDRSPPDEFAVHGTEIYLRFPNGYGNTKLGGDYFERTLKVRGTARNWRTTTKLLELAGA